MSNQEQSNESGRDGLPDLSILADFQFGPSWARKGAETSARLPEGRGMRERRHEDNRGGQGERRRFREGDRGERGERRRFQEGGREQRRPEGRSFGKGRFEGKSGDRFRRSERGERPERILPDPTPGLRVELRPADSVLVIFEQEVRKHKRAVSAMELAKVVMAEKNRYDIVLMKQDGGPSMIVSKKGDGACWLERREALDYLFSAPWFSEYYEAVQEEVEPPKGTFTAIAKCGFSGQLIGPVNWHGYQMALQTLHRSRFSNMSFEHYRDRVVLEKTQEAVDAWMAQASRKTVWKPLREGAGDVALADEKAVEKDFEEHHFDDVYAEESKVFVNGATPRRLLSPGLGAHAAILSDKTRRAPQMLIPNLCHGLARHRLAIFKWKGRHYTGVSRVRGIPVDTVLADRMMAIVEWAKAHQGQTADKMFAELSGVSGDDKERSAEAYAPYVADMMWLMEQGFILVMTDNTVWFPKSAEQAGKSTENNASKKEVPASSGKQKAKKGKQRSSAPREADKPSEHAFDKEESTEPAESPDSVESAGGDVAVGEIEESSLSPADPAISAEVPAEEKPSASDVPAEETMPRETSVAETEPAAEETTNRDATALESTRQEGEISQEGKGQEPSAQ